MVTNSRLRRSRRPSLSERPAALIGAVDAHRGAIAVHHAAHLVRRQEDRGAAFIGNQEAVAVGVALDAPGDQRDALGDEQRAGAVLHHLARALERGEAGVEGAALARADVQAIGELVGTQRLARAPELAPDLATGIVRRRRAAARCARCSACDRSSAEYSAMARTFSRQ